MSNTIMQRCEAIRKSLDEYHNDQTEKFYETVGGVIYTIYLGLSHEIQQRIGLKQKVTLHSCQMPYASKGYDRAVRERCGIEILQHIYTGQNQEDLTINIVAKNLQCCTVNANNQTTMKLNFPRLLREAAQREATWNDYLEDTAKSCIDDLKQALNALPNKHYGIPEVVALKEHLLFKDFLISSNKVTYQNLYKKQRVQLIKEINRHLSHAKVTLDDAEKGSVCIHWHPHKVVTEPFYDYVEFYNFYNKVTPELQKVFDVIADNLQPLSLEEQLAFDQGEPVRQLSYWFKENDAKLLDFNAMEGVINSPALSEGLRETIKQKYQVAIKTIRHDAVWDGKHNSIKGSNITFFYQPLPDIKEPEFYTGVTMAQLEVVRQSLWNNTGDIAEKIIGEVLQIAEERIKAKDFSKRQIHLQNPEFNIEGVAINLTNLDHYLQEKIGQEIGKLSNGLIYASLGCINFNIKP